LGFTAHGICRFYLKELSPEVEVYVTPVNIDPGHPDLPISHPVTYSIYLAKLFGPYATLGLAEDTWRSTSMCSMTMPSWRRLTAIMKIASACSSMHWIKRSRGCVHACSIRRTASSTC